MAATGGTQVTVKRELEEDPLDISKFFSLKYKLLLLKNFIAAIPVAPKTIRKDDAGTSSVIRLKPVNQISKPTVVPIAPKPAVVVTRAPDFSMLNKPPPLQWSLPKSAVSAPRVVQENPMNDPPDVALQKLESEATTLKEEVAALKWLAKRKEQEWNNIITLLKRKEETWLKVKRQAELTVVDRGLHKFKTVAPNLAPSATVVHPTPVSVLHPNSGPIHVPSPMMPDAPPPIQIRMSSSSGTSTAITKTISVSAANAQAAGARKVLVPVTQPLTAQTIQALSSQGLLKSGGMTADGKRIIVVKKAPGAGAGPIVVQKSSGGLTKPPSIIINSAQGNRPVTKVVMSTGSTPKVVVSTTNSEKKTNPMCGECKTKVSKFECAGCSKMKYCSRECQEKNWSKHEKECGILSGNAVIKQEVTTIDD